MGRGTKLTLSQRRHKNNQQVHEKILNITTYQGNDIQFYFVLTFKS